jgi:uncharacterized protein YlxW (UPF0749 family)
MRTGSVASQPAALENRSRLVEEVQGRTATVDDLQARVEQLQLDVRDLQSRSDVVNRLTDDLRDQLTLLLQASATTAVKGEGVTVTLNDAPKGPDGTVPTGGRIRDRDVQDVVNALWSGGAEAISVGGRRLTSLTAIRTAGEAILVDYRPLSPPYLVEAIGRRDDLREALDRDPAVQQVIADSKASGFTVTVATAKELQLAAGTQGSLRRASPLPGSSPAVTLPAPTRTSPGSPSPSAAPTGPPGGPTPP